MQRKHAIAKAAHLFFPSLQYVKIHLQIDNGAILEMGLHIRCRPYDTYGGIQDMIRLDLTKEEAEELLDLLQYEHSELRMEIAGTDRESFRNQLKARKATLKGVRERLENLQAQELGKTA